MSLLVVVLTHLEPRAVEAHLQYLEGLAPGTEVVLCHGGARADFEAVQHEPKFFVEEPSLRGKPLTFQSYNELLSTVQREVMSRGDWPGLVFLEFDHLPLRADWAERALNAFTRSGADFLGIDCSSRNDTNWYHYLRLRDDAGLRQFLHRISVRENPDLLFGCLGTGFMIGRRALAAFAELPHYEPSYIELYLPTVLHHLGFRVADLSLESDFGRAVRWRPPYTLDEAVRVRASGTTFIHPFKDHAALAELSRSRSAPAG